MALSRTVLGDRHKKKVEVWKEMMANYSEKEQTAALNSAVECLKAQNEVLDSVCEKYMSTMTC